MLRILINGRSSDFDETISRLTNQLKETDLDSEEYDALLSRLERLNKLKTEDRSRRVSPDTMAIIAANLFGIVIVVGYERGHALVSKGLGLVLKPKNQ